MNIFLISPGRTATATFAEALSKVDGFTSAHESRNQYLGDERLNYPPQHFECDNRLVWFLPRLTKRFGGNGVLVNIIRDRETVAESYNKRWAGLRIMKAYSQGILGRNLRENNLDVCRDYVNNVYEQIDFFSMHWDNYIEVDLRNVDDGMKKLFGILGVDGDAALQFFKENKLNESQSSWRRRFNYFKSNLKMLWYDLWV